MLQLGGSTRDLYYYPKGTVQVTAAGPALSVSLWEQAGMQAGVPVRAVKSSASDAGDLSFMGGGSADSVVVINRLHDVRDARAFAREASQPGRGLPGWAGAGQGV